TSQSAFAFSGRSSMNASMCTKLEPKTPNALSITTSARPRPELVWRWKKPASPVASHCPLAVAGRLNTSAWTRSTSAGVGAPGGEVRAADVLDAEPQGGLQHEARAEVLRVVAVEHDAVLLDATDGRERGLRCRDCERHVPQGARRDRVEGGRGVPRCARGRPCRRKRWNVVSEAVEQPERHAREERLCAREAVRVAGLDRDRADRPGGRECD